LASVKKIGNGIEMTTREEQKMGLLLKRSAIAGGLGAQRPSLKRGQQALRGDSLAINIFRRFRETLPQIGQALVAGAGFAAAVPSPVKGPERPFRIGHRDETRELLVGGGALGYGVPHNDKSARILRCK
jgi:hypothetical protein